MTKSTKTILNKPILICLSCCISLITLNGVFSSQKEIEVITGGVVKHFEVEPVDGEQPVDPRQVELPEVVNAGAREAREAGDREGEEEEEQVEEEEQEEEEEREEEGEADSTYWSRGTPEGLWPPAWPPLGLVAWSPSPWTTSASSAMVSNLPMMSYFLLQRLQWSQ